MALLTFPPFPSNGDLYPTSPLPGQNQYQWDSTDQTWRLVAAATTVAPGTYGNSTNVSQFTVDATGRITFAQNVPIASSAGGTVTDVTVGTGLLGGTITTSGTIDLDTAYTDGIYTKYVAAPTASTDPGFVGEVAVDASYFYWYAGGSWHRVAEDTTPW